MATPTTNQLNDTPKQGNSGTEKCNDPRCIETLQLIIDGQAGPEDDAFFQSHIQECMPCYRKYSLEKSIKDVLLLKVEKKCVPSELINAIKEKIKATTV